MTIQDEILDLSNQIQDNYTNVTSDKKITANKLKETLSTVKDIAVEVGVKLNQNDATDAAQTAKDTEHDAALNQNIQVDTAQSGRIATLEARRDVAKPLSSPPDPHDRFGVYAINNFMSGIIEKMDANKGKVTVKTNIREGMNTAFKIFVSGTDFLRGKADIDFKIAGYAYLDTIGNIDGTRKGFHHPVSLTRRDDGTFPIAIGITSDGYVAFELGDDNTEWYSLTFRTTCEVGNQNWMNTEKDWALVAPQSYVHYQILTPVTPA